MAHHIKAWNDEYGKSIWKGHYSLLLPDSCDRKGVVLDAGCGSGKYSIPLRMRGFDVVGIDVSFRALKMLREIGEARRLEINMMAANVFQLPFKDNSFNMVWCYGVIQHLLSEERERAVEEFHRALNKGGYLFLEVFGKEDMRYGGIEVEPDTFSRKNGIIYHYFGRSELENLLKDFSFEITESRKEKRFKGKLYMRNMISVVARKN